MEVKGGGGHERHEMRPQRWWQRVGLVLGRERGLVGDEARSACVHRAVRKGKADVASQRVAPPSLQERKVPKIQRGLTVTSVDGAGLARVLQRCADA